MFEFDEVPEIGQAKIKVVGVGGGGGNAINTMIEGGIQGVDFVVVNTDCQAVAASQAATKIPIGKGLTKGLGAGANPEVGEAAALEDTARLNEVLSGADMVFVTAGMGGGTGTGAAPVVAQIARDAGALTVGVVTRPFVFEGLQRKKRAIGGIEKLARAVDALIVIPNDRLMAVAGKKTSLKDSFALVDAVCLNAVRGISDLVMVPGLVNVDFADVRTIMTGAGRALMGTGRASGENRAVEAARMAINSPLLEDSSIAGATGVLVNITGGIDLTLAEVSDACNLIHEAVDKDCNIIFGSVVDANAGDSVSITVIATGFAAVAQAVGSKGGPIAARGAQAGQMALPIAAAAPVESAARRTSAVIVGGSSAGYPTSGALPVELNTAESTDRSPYGLGVAVTPEAPVPARVAAEMPVAQALPEEDVPALDALVGAVVAGQGGEASAEWAGAPSSGYEARPVIRPPQTGPHATRWPGLAGPSLQGADDLGIEENEWDKPAYLRRRTTQEQAMQVHTPVPGRVLGRR